LVLAAAAWWPAAGSAPPAQSAAEPARAAVAAGMPWLWREGESADRHTFNNHPWYCCADLQLDLLSPGEPEAAPGAWLAHYSTDGRTARAEYDLDVEQEGEYTLWLRVSSYQCLYRWAFANGPAGQLDPGQDPRERVNLRADRRPELREIAWQRVADVRLAAGPARLVVEVVGHPARGQEVHGGIDALTLVATGAPWAPTGALRPPAGSEPEPAAEDWFPFVPYDDPFDPASALDASSLLHRPAGRHGPLQRRGDHLAFADGTSAVLWGVNALPPATEALMERQARWLAKHGVNLVRLHPVSSVVGLLQSDATGGERRPDPERLRTLALWLEILKQHGIYMAWSPSYPHVVTAADGYPQDLLAELPEAPTWNLPPGTSGKSAAGMIHFMPALQQAQWAWLERVLTYESPYSGLRLIDDPALAVVETHNEDSLLWHFPLNALQSGQFPLHLRELQRQWAVWLRTRYADDAALLAAWGPSGAGSRPGDSLANERLPIYGAWEFGSSGPPQHPLEQARLGDCIRFLADTQRGFYERREALLRAAGFRAVTVTTAWQAGGPAAHLANLWTDTAADAVDRHAYFGGGSGGHHVRAGPVDDATHLERPGTGILARGLEQWQDRPFFLSEWTQSPPNRWKAEITPLIALYGMGLHGWDAAVHFAAGENGRYAGGWPNEGSYVTETPHYAAQMAVLARAVHQGHVRAGPPAAARRLMHDTAFWGVDPLGLPGSWDGDARLHPDMRLPPEVFAIGPTTITTADSRPSRRLDWDAYWDRDAAVVESATSELTWDMRRRVVLARSERTQGVVGWAGDGGGAWELPAASLEIRTPFVSLFFVALDNLPLARSRRVLVSALARDRQQGARYSPDGLRLEALGGPPLLLQPVVARVTWRGAPPLAVRALDIHGVPRGSPLPLEGRRLDLDGRWATYLYLLETAGDGAETPTPAHDPTATPTAGTPATPTGPPPGGPLVLPWLGAGARQHGAATAGASKTQAGVAVGALDGGVHEAFGRGALKLFLKRELFEPEAADGLLQSLHSGFSVHESLCPDGNGRRERVRRVASPVGAAHVGRSAAAPRPRTGGRPGGNGVYPARVGLTVPSPHHCHRTIRGAKPHDAVPHCSAGSSSDQLDACVMWAHADAVAEPEHIVGAKPRIGTSYRGPTVRQ